MSETTDNSQAGGRCAPAPGSGFRAFQLRELDAAQQWAAEGGQALHLMPGSFAYGRADTPNCFKDRTQIGHLFDQSKERLISTARKLGVRVIRVERDGQRGQHIDLCGKPLARAVELCPNTYDQAILAIQKEEPKLFRAISGSKGNS